MIVYDKITIDTYSFKVTYDGTIIELNPKEFFLLKFFLQRQNQVLTYEAIIAQVWEFNKVPTYSCIRSHVKRIRQAFKKAKAEEFIETVHGIGYRLKPLNKKKEKAYLVIDDSFKITDLSSEIFSYCYHPDTLKVDCPFRKAFPDLTGLEVMFPTVINKETKKIELHGVERIYKSEKRESIKLTLVANEEERIKQSAANNKLLVFFEQN